MSRRDSTWRTEPEYSPVNFRAVAPWSFTSRSNAERNAARISDIVASLACITKWSWTPERRTCATLRAQLRPKTSSTIVASQNVWRRMLRRSFAKTLYWSGVLRAARRLHEAAGHQSLPSGTAFCAVSARLERPQKVDDRLLVFGRKLVEVA